MIEKQGTFTEPRDGTTYILAILALAIILQNCSTEIPPFQPPEAGVSSSFSSSDLEDKVSSSSLMPEISSSSSYSETSSDSSSTTLSSNSIPSSSSGVMLSSSSSSSSTTVSSNSTLPSSSSATLSSSSITPSSSSIKPSSSSSNKGSATDCQYQPSWCKGKNLAKVIVNFGGGYAIEQETCVFVKNFSEIVGGNDIIINGVSFNNAHEVEKDSEADGGYYIYIGQNKGVPMGVASGVPNCNYLASSSSGSTDVNTVITVKGNMTINNGTYTIANTITCQGACYVYGEDCRTTGISGYCSGNPGSYCSSLEFMAGSSVTISGGTLRIDSCL